MLKVFFNKISNKILLRPLFYTDEFCMEIDTIKDLTGASTQHTY